MKISYLLFTLMLLTTSFVLYGQENSTYEDAELIIPFDTLKVIGNPKTRNYCGFRVKKVVRFMKSKSYAGQSLNSNDPFQCYLYICQKTTLLSKKTKAVLGCDKELIDDERRNAELIQFEKIRMNNRDVLKWRYTYSKTRLDHFLITGKRRLYLFVSSPYGSNGTIEDIIGTIIWK